MKYNYQRISSSLLRGLPARTTEVLEKRFGLKGGERQTLEAIGGGLGITRERVRQIAEEGFSKIKPRLESYKGVFNGFGETLKASGDLKREDILLKDLGGSNAQNQVFFLLTVAPSFQRFAGDNDFYSFWTQRKDALDLAKKIITVSINKFQSSKAPLSLDALFVGVKSGLQEILGKKANKEFLNSYLEISKKVRQNPEGKFGLKNWIEINPRGIKDKAYLILKKENKPLHFTAVAGLIGNMQFANQKKVQVAAVHNELIRDSRFVLVGRGLYALKEWGYQPGVVKDVILCVLKEAPKPLSKNEIVKKVLAQRLVKENTVLLNLQDKNYFTRDAEGRYFIKEA